MSKTLKVASHYATHDAGTNVAATSDFSISLEALVREVKPFSIIETGTFHGTGTTAAIGRGLSSLRNLRSLFYTIEINPHNYGIALRNLQNDGLLQYVHALNGLSLPRGLLPSRDQIQTMYVNACPHADIFVDHEECDRAEKYYLETANENAPDDLLELCLRQSDYCPELVVLDSAGHLGFIEFNYVLSKLRGVCFFALDDTCHVKHHDSLLLMKKDSRFELLKDSKEKFGFCIARFTPESLAGRRNAVRSRPADAPAPEHKPLPVAEHPFLSRFTFERAKRVVPDAANVRHLLYVRLDAIGDAILASRAVSVVRQAYPRAKITVLCDSLCAPLYEHCKYIHSILHVDKNSIKTSAGFTDARKKILKISPDIVVNFTRSNTPETLALSLLADAPLVAVANDTSNMTAAMRDCLSAFASTLIPLPAHPAETEIYDHLAEFYGQDARAHKQAVWLSGEAQESAGRLWEKTGFIPAATIALFAAGSQTIRDYAELGKAVAPVCKNFKFSVACLGGGGRERELHRHVCSCLKRSGIPAFNFSGHLTLPESAALLSRCRLAVGAETGLGHMACALEVPQVIILGGGHFGRFMPYSPLTTAVCLPLECYNCNWRCRYSSPWCLAGIAPATVTEAVELVLERGGGGKNGRLFLQKPTSIKRGTHLPRWRSPRNFMASKFGQGVDVLRST
ncbi:MAG: glycosyltransferase family 9 protein [Desulfovibrio sp.]|jgi:ADP-heptose:LPS heptosyltransferase|nr:glycosyltransferase family 9 protein [Desulfovibrio sp.]